MYSETNSQSILIPPAATARVPREFINFANKEILAPQPERSVVIH